MTTSLSSMFRAIAQDSGANISVWVPGGTVVYRTPACIRASTDAAEHRLSVSNEFALLPRVMEERMRIHAQLRGGTEVIRLLEFLHGRLQLSTHRVMVNDGPPGAVCVSSYPIETREQYLELRNDPNVRMAGSNAGGALGDIGVRQLEVLRLIGLGVAGPDIARTLHRSPRTVEFHRKVLRDRLKSDSIVNLARIAHRSGIVHLTEEEIEEWWARDMHGCMNEPVFAVAVAS